MSTYTTPGAYIAHVQNSTAAKILDLQSVQTLAVAAATRLKTIYPEVVAKLAKHKIKVNGIQNISDVDKNSTSLVVWLNATSSKTYVNSSSAVHEWCKRVQADLVGTDYAVQINPYSFVLGISKTTKANEEHPVLAEICIDLI